MEEISKLQNDVDALVAPLIHQDSRLAVSVGVTNDKHTHFFCYGHPFQISEDSTTPDTLFEIASSTKVFTTTLLALLVEKGTISLDTPVNTLIPSAISLPHTLTLLELATHTSGLPTMPGNVLFHLLRNPGNPYASYTYKEVLQAVQSFKKPSSTIPAPYNYSNLGYALLAYIVAKQLHEPFESAMQHLLCHPLGMKDTGYHLKADQRLRLAQGFSSAGRAAPNWEMGALEGAGGLYSSARDLIYFLQAHLGSSHVLSGSVRTLCHKEYANIPPHDTSALGWIVTKDQKSKTKMYWKDGASTGYRSFLGLIKEKKISVVVLTNVGFNIFFPWRKQITAEDIGLAILRNVAAS